MECTQEAEIERMMDVYGSMLLRLCAGILGDAYLAQDAVQDTFVKAYRRLSGFRGQHGETERAWLVRIAVNTCRDYRRTAWFRMVDRRIPLEALLDAAAQTDGSGETDREVLAAVRKLPAKHREVIMLHYYEEMPAEKIARALGVTRSTVYRRLERAEQQLRRLLERGKIHG